MAVGGDIIEITYNHPTIGSGTIYPKAGEDSTYDLGGFRADDDANNVDGSGEMITSLTRKLWSFEATVAWDQNVRKDLENITALAADPVPANWTFSCINGITYAGKGRPVGDVQGNGKAATFSMKVAGGGVLKQL